MKSTEESVGEELVACGIVTADQMTEVRTHLENLGKNAPSLTAYLIKRGYVKEEQLLELQAKKLNIPFTTLIGVSPDPNLVTLVPEEMAVDKGVILLRKENNIAHVAMQNPSDISAIEPLERITGCRLQIYLASRWSILKKVSEYHDHYKIKMVEKLLSSTRDQTVELSRSLGLESSISNAADQGPIIKQVNLILLGALMKRTSDIHLVPDARGLHVRYRVDGTLMESEMLSGSLAAGIVSRIKIMSNLNIAEHRLPQDGTFHIKLEGRSIDFRVAITPTVHGEKVIMRVLDKGAMMLGLDYLGFTEENLNKFKEVIHKPNGIILVVGPTGSGKTTTLYSALTALNTGEENITTVEDPVESELEGMTQIQVNAEVGLDFSKILRSVLRQDPDVILIGEIRDLETTEIAIRAALTGHLVFATLHANDAAGAIARLVEMGAEPHLVASSLRCVVSQRLVRSNCPDCLTSTPLTPEARLFLSDKIKADLSTAKISRGRGCKACFMTGYFGRVGINEVLLVDEDIRRKILMKSTSSEIQSVALLKGMKTLFEDGLGKVLQGQTTIEEVLEVCEVAESDAVAFNRAVRSIQASDEAREAQKKAGGAPAAAAPAAAPAQAAPAAPRVGFPNPRPATAAPASPPIPAPVSPPVPAAPAPAAAPRPPVPSAPPPQFQPPPAPLPVQPPPPAPIPSPARMAAPPTAAPLAPAPGPDRTGTQPITTPIPSAGLNGPLKP